MITRSRIQPGQGVLQGIFLCAALGLSTGCVYTNTLNDKPVDPIAGYMGYGAQSNDPVLKVISERYLEAKDPKLAESANKAREEVLRVYHQGWDDALAEQLKRSRLKCQTSKNITKDGKTVITFNNCTPAQP